ncbi:S2538-like protein [Mya arenaria]|uniref:Mitochondrial glycine transporter n=1 Tax=Mya arenaria TaxID=6604 RepID=A0ABY7DK32_MYAAR|nr:mitochondrial glycine transporter-like isoform X2 [Mya arenaria]XP_052774445.1 mitochondrial glycine transporter-like isoform X2 [Mya arenaria]WAQ96692.1 S2538-like protein [Mya arenaria]WAQ96700.1 S2538-like protein [Mya arenaria]
MESTLTSPVVKSFLAGSLSGTCSTLLFQPLDLVKTRVQSAVCINGARPAGMMSIVATVIQQDRIVGLWRGIVPSISRCVPGIGIYFSTIHYLKGRFEHTKSPLESMVIGGSARSVAVVTMLPFTVLKTRYEGGEFRCNNMLRGLTSIYHLEGMKGLFSGFSATLLRDVPFSGLYFMFYTQLKQLSETANVPDSRLPMFHFSCGMSAGMMASMITQPADVLKTHMQLYPKKHGGLLNVARFVYERDGMPGFWRGIIPRTIRRTLMAAMAWTVYEEVAKSMGLK